MDKEVPSLLTMWLFGVSALGIIGTVALFVMVNAGFFQHYDLTLDAMTGGPAPAIALVPFAVAVIAGATASVTWTIERRAA